MLCLVLPLLPLRSCTNDVIDVTKDVNSNSSGTVVSNTNSSGIFVPATMNSLQTSIPERTSAAKSKENCLNVSLPPILLRDSQILSHESLSLSFSEQTSLSK